MPPSKPPVKKRPPATATPPRKSSEQLEAEEREAFALGYKKDGYNSSVVTRKMISVHGMSEAAAEALVGRIFGKSVSARTGDTTVAIISGLGLAVAATLTIFAMWWFIPITPGWLLLVYAALVGVIGKGLTQAVIAMINVNARDELAKKD